MQVFVSIERRRGLFLWAVANLGSTDGGLAQAAVVPYRPPIEGSEAILEACRGR